MNYKQVTAIALLCGAMGIMEARSQSMVVQMKDGTENTSLLASLRSFTTPTTSMVINQKNGSNQTLALADVRKIYFKDVAIFAPTAVSSLSAENDVQLYPNPVSTALYIKNLTEDATAITIFGIDGAVVKEAIVSEQDNEVDVAALDKGLYLIRLSNKTLKFNKL